jgi:hypothetical protein
MADLPQENEIARRAAAQGWVCGATLSGVHVGGDARLTWRLGDELWLTAAHDFRALERENALLVRLLPILDRSMAVFTVPEPVPTAAGDLTLISDGFGWRVTRHISGRRPDDDSLDTYRQSVDALRRIHEILRLLPDDVAVAEPVT